MSKHKLLATGNKVGRDLVQRSDAEGAEISAESNEIKGSLTQEALGAKKEDIEKVLMEVLTAIERLGLKEDDKADLKAHTETAQTQLKAKTPKPAIITESLKSIWETLKGAATSAAASGAGVLVKELMNRVAGFLS